MEEEDLLATSPPKGQGLSSPPKPPSASDTSKSPNKAVPAKKYEELVKRLRILVAQRTEDREQIKALSKYKEEAEPYMNARHKLRAKLIELQSDLTTAKKQNRDLEHEHEVSENRHSELTDQVEMATLDKEVAEEKLVQNETLVSTLTEKVAELEIRASLYKDQLPGSPTKDDAANSDNSFTLTQLQRQNERLKDALARLRDLSLESENGYRKRIGELERELDLTSEIQDSHENTTKLLEAAEAQIEDLKLQLDDAMGAEDMLEQLTERNLTLSERLDEMRTTIQDLEALKELNDELEESHLESEKQLQEEVDLREFQLKEARQRNKLFEENITDYENTIFQFRDLVVTLQSDIDSMREQEHTQRNHSEALTSQSQAILNMNMKLQSTLLKGHVKTIDMELRKFEAAQAINRLEVVNSYLPRSFADGGDCDAVDALLFFERLSFKAAVLSSALEQIHNISESLDGDIPEILVTVCETRAKLAAFSALSRRFAANLRRCDPETFLKMGNTYRELTNIEKKLDVYIDAVRREELREVDCGKDVDMFISQAAHVAETQLVESGLDVGEQHLGQIITIDMNLDTLSAGMGYSLQNLLDLNKEGDVPFDVGGEDVDDVLFDPLKQIFDRSRSCKVISQKYLRRLEELVDKCNILSSDAAEPLDSLARQCHRIGSFCVKMSDLISHYVLELRTNKSQPFKLQTFYDILQEVTLDLELPTSSTTTGSNNEKLDAIISLVTDIQSKLSASLTSAMTPDHIFHATFESPWSVRVAEIESSSAATMDAQLRVAKLNEEMRDLTRDLRAKDQTIQERGMKIEIMEKRMESVKKQADVMTELELQLQKAKHQERSYEEALESLQNDLDKVEQDNLRLKQAASNAEKSGVSGLPGPYSGNAEFITFTGSLETSQLVEQIESLRGSVRFLRAENSLIKSRKLLAELSPLPTYSQAIGMPIVASRVNDKKDGRNDSSSERPDDKRPDKPLRSSNTPNTYRKQEIAIESRKLLQEAIAISCSPKVIDLTKLPAYSIAATASKENEAGSRSVSRWTRQESRPERQLQAQRERMQDFLKRAQALKEKIHDTSMPTSWKTT